MVSSRLFSLLALAGLARATVTSVVYVTEYEYDCNACPATGTTVVVVAPSPVGQAVVAAQGNTVKTTVVAQTTIAAITAAKTSVVAPSIQSSTAASPTGSTKSPTAIVQAASASISACPATAHTDALGSKNYPRIITPVSSTSPNLVYGPQYFASLGGGNSTIFTFDYQTAGTCTLEFKFPTMAQIVALNGTTSYTLSGSSIAVTLYQLASVAAADADYADKPARGAAFSTVLTPGTNSTITSFACPVGTSVSYEMVATDSNTLVWFEDYNPPPLGLLALMC